MKINSRLLITASLALGLAQFSAAAVETHTIDPVHSSVGFGIRHFVSKVQGKFAKFSGTITLDRTNLEQSAVDATIDVTSISTENQKRDEHLRTPDFFDAEKYPTMTFKSRQWKKTGENTFDVTGAFTLKGVTKDVVLKVTLLGFGPGMGGAQLSGWEATTIISKKQFNLAGPAMLAAALGDDVAITINVEAKKG